VDCYFHSNVPSVARCSDCRKPICATCHAGDGMCPSCRLAAKINAANTPREELRGGVPRQRKAAPVSVLEDSVESRALVALGYPLPPLAILALFDRKQSPYLRRQVYQSLAFSGGMALFGLVLSWMLAIPFLNISAMLILAVLFPVWLVGSVVYGIKTYNGDDVRIPIVTDWIEERLPA